VPWAFLHQTKLEMDHGLALAGLLVTIIPNSKCSLSFAEEAAIDAIGQQLLRNRRAGPLPAALCWVWSDGRPMAPIKGTGDRWMTLGVAARNDERSNAQ